MDNTSQRETLIELRHIHKIYYLGGEEVRANDDISLKIDRGEFVAIVGKSGSGKSTLMNIIGALDVPTDGEYLLGGEDVGIMDDKQLARIRNKMIGFIFQQYNLLPKLNILENVELPLLYAGVGNAERRERAMASLEKVGLSEKWKNMPNQLSGGQQQRVAIGRALITRPKLILADEPTGNLDSKNSQDVMDLLTQASRHYQQTILMITHSLLYQFYTFMQNMSCTNKYNFFIFVSDCCYIICHYTSPLSYSYTDKKVKYQKENNNSQESKESSFQN